MAASPDYKVYQAKEYRAACKYTEDAAALVAFLGEGTEIRWGHNVIVWTEGSESQPASESYDHVTEVVAGRVAAHIRRLDVKRTEEAEAARVKMAEIRRARAASISSQD